MRKIGIVVICLLFGFLAEAQVGINNPSPDENAVLDLKATDKGFLIPRLTTVQREAMSSGAGFSQGMMVYDINLDVLFVGYGVGATGNVKWYAMNPWKTEYRTNNNSSVADMTTMTVNPGSTIGGVGMSNYGNVGIGIIVPQEKLHVDGQVKATGFKGFGITPIGGIIMWSGALNAIPAGWALCNGQNGIPDLQERFVVGAGSADNISVPGSTQYALNAKGGENSVTLSESTIPSHRHSGYTSTDGAHSHTGQENARADNDDNDGIGYYIGGRGGSFNNNGGNGYILSTGSAHKHYFSTNPTGGGQSHENRPPYYALAYIMRTQ